MARNFDGTDDHLHWDGAHLTTGNQNSVSVWFYKDVVGLDTTRLAHFNGSNRVFMISVDGDSGEYVHFLSAVGGSSYGTATDKRLRVIAAEGAWHHVCGTVSSGSTKTVESAYFNGAVMTDTAGGSWNAGGSSTDIFVGARNDGASDYNGKVAEFAVWDSYQLTAEDAAALAAGISPLRIQPDKLVHYAPLSGEGSTEFDMISGKSATFVSAPAQFEHPLIMSPVPMVVTRSAPAVGGGLSIPVAMSSYRRHHLGAMH